MLRITLLCLLFICAAADCNAAERRWPPEQVLADFDVLYQSLRESHFDLYANRSRGAYDDLYRATRERLQQPMTLAAIQGEFQRFVAFGNVAHARIDPPIAAWEAYRAEGGKAFPLLFRVHEGEVYIQEVLGAIDLSVGQQVLSVDGQPALNWLQRLRRHVSADNDYLAFTMMENSLPLLVWQEYGALDSVTLEIAQGSAAAKRFEVPCLSRAAQEAAPTAVAFMLDWNARESRILDGGIAYLRPGPFYDNRPQADHPWDPSDFQRFVDESFASFNEAGVKQLLIDLRNNPGGSNGFSDYLLAWFADRAFRFSDRFDIRVSEAAIAANRERLGQQAQGADSISQQLAATYANQSMGSVVPFPVSLVEPRAEERFEGQVTILVNRHTYSNAVSVAAIVQDYGFGAVLGEATADLVNTYGGMEHFSLPATGIRVGFPKARILRPNGDERADTVVPDIAIPAALAPKHDEMLEQALLILARHS